MSGQAKAPVLILAGGTGGHVYPALAVASVLREEGVPLVWVGTRRGLEVRVIPQNNIAVEWIRISGLRGKSKLALLLVPFKLALAALQAMRILKRVKPCCVLGMGGFVAGPCGLMASLKGIPLIIHEQNKVPGLTNRLLSPRADTVLQAFPDAFLPRANAVHVGNPVRADMIGLPEPQQRLRLDERPLRLLVLGGSLGAHVLNTVVPEALALIDERERPVVRHQAGRAHHQSTIGVYRQCRVEAQVDRFIEGMGSAYAWADLVICRAGAMTIAELAVVGAPAILVPYPYAADDHQTANAMYLAARKGAVLMQQDELDARQLADRLRDFCRNRGKLLAMANIARSLGRPDATQKIAEIILRRGRRA